MMQQGKPPLKDTKDRSENIISKKKKATRAVNMKHNFKWREEIGWTCEIYAVASILPLPT